MLEIDFLPVESETGPGSKSGDAICLRFASTGDEEQKIIVIDGGYGSVGDKLAHHIRTFYQTDKIDLVVSTHPDADHLNGLIRLVESMDVREVMLHLPWAHRDDVSDYSNIEKIRELYTTAVNKKIRVTEPFEGAVRFNGRYRILGPSISYYEDLLTEDLGEEQARKAKAEASVLVLAAIEAADAAFESADGLDDLDTTSARNSSSVVSLVTEAGEYHLFTGDAGITALDKAADEFEKKVERLAECSIEFWQVPHHGSRRNLGPAVLDRWFPNGGWGATAFVSSALADKKHPGEAVVTDLKTRGFDLFMTEGKYLLHHHGGRARGAYYSPSPA